MTEDELSAILADYFDDWTPDPADGWFRVEQAARLMGVPHNTAVNRLEAGMKRGDIEKRKRSRETWYRFVNRDGAIGGGG